jgi:hypothetical protein
VTLLEELEARVRDMQNARGIPTARRARAILLATTAAEFYRRAAAEADAAGLELEELQEAARGKAELLEALREVFREYADPDHPRQDPHPDAPGSRGRAFVRLRIERDEAYVLSAEAALRLARARLLEHRAAAVVDDAMRLYARVAVPAPELVPDRIDFGSSRE